MSRRQNVLINNELMEGGERQETVALTRIQYKNIICNTLIKYLRCGRGGS